WLVQSKPVAACDPPATRQQGLVPGRSARRPASATEACAARSKCPRHLWVYRHSFVRWPGGVRNPGCRERSQNARGKCPPLCRTVHSRNRIGPGLPIDLLVTSLFPDQKPSELALWLWSDSQETAMPNRVPH